MLSPRRLVQSSLKCKSTRSGGAACWWWHVGGNDSAECVHPAIGGWCSRRPHAKHPPAGAAVTPNVSLCLVLRTGAAACWWWHVRGAGIGSTASGWCPCRVFKSWAFLECQYPTDTSSFSIPACNLLHGVDVNVIPSAPGRMGCPDDVPDGPPVLKLRGHVQRVVLGGKSHCPKSQYVIRGCDAN